MNISTVAGTYAQQAYNSQIGSKRPVKGSVLDSNVSKSRIDQPRDRVEISRESKERMSSIQKRISTGFYNTREVAEDISDKLTKYFDEATE